MSDHELTELHAEAEGATLGEAKWNAVKQLEPRFPGVSADCVSFEVLAEGDEESGEPARVRAELDEEAWETSSNEIPEEPAERVRAVVGRVVHALGLHATVDIEESDEEIRATVNGDDLGLLIGRHGATIDALQHIAMRAAFHGLAEHKAVVVDAAGYRERREATLKRAADRAVEDALSYGRPVELEPMGPQERRIVHLYLRDRPEIQTHSEGDEPDRRLVVSPVKPQG
ncbi:MAG TPA: R3H domain-containing nucleic acid-binding protein [Thermoleophilaceae bacterium]|nr:R3H domain-containing nucleic acid-binding protein [Thermoleophilaceae bacterium]